MPGEAEYRFDGYVCRAHAGQVMLRKKATPIFETCWLLPFVILAPLLGFGSIYAAYAIAFSAEGSAWPRTLLSVGFLLAACVVWVFLKRALVVCLPSTKRIWRLDNVADCGTYIRGLRVRHKKLLCPLQVEVQVYELRSDWGFWLCLRGDNGAAFRLTIPTAVATTSTEARRAGHECAAFIAAEIGARIS